MKFILLNLFFTTQIFAQDLSHGKTTSEIEQLRKKATLKLTISTNDKMNVFSGFFYGSEGYFITVHHTFRNLKFFENKNPKINIIDNDGNTFKNIIINACTNENNVDLCLGQIKDYKPKNYLTYNGVATVKGIDFNSFGNCNADFSAKRGKIVTVTDLYQSSYVGAWQDIYNKNTRLLELNLPACVGDSGGALFDSFTGNLVGMYSFQLNGKYFAIDASVIDKYFKQHSKSTKHLIDEKMYLQLNNEQLDDDPCANKNLTQKEKEFCSQ